MEVKVLLSTFNGERFLGAFLESLSHQTFKDWTLVVRDDGSKDNTLDIVKKFSQSLHLRERILIQQDNLGTLGPCRSFLTLLQRVDGDYFFFADQDDVWLPSKIEKLLNKMIEIENQYGKDMPILLHSDAVVVDQNMREIAPSLWQYERLNPEKKSLNYLLVQNNITGCCMVVNRALRVLVREIPFKAAMHDWWLGLIASAFGRIEYYPEQLILYRQHPWQNTGARGYGVCALMKRALNRKDMGYSVRRAFFQAREFLRIYGPHLSPVQRELINAFLTLPKLNFYRKISCISNYKFYKNGFIKNLGYIVVLLWLGEKANES